MIFTNVAFSEQGAVVAVSPLPAGDEWLSSDVLKFFYAVASKHLILIGGHLNGTFYIIVSNKNFLNACERPAFCTWSGAVKDKAGRGAEAERSATALLGLW